MSKILFISTRYPFPIFGGDKLRAFGILKFLSKKNKVDLVCLGKKNQPSKNELAFCNNIKVFHSHFLIRILNILFSFLQFQPLQNGYYLSKEMKNYIDSVQDKYDTIICHLLRSSQYLPDNFSKKTILDSTDLLSLNYEQSIKKLSIFNPLKYIYIIEKILVQRYEEKTFRKFNCIVFVSNKDAIKAKKKVLKKNKIIVIGNTKSINPKIFSYKKNNNKIIFIGNIKYLPNRLACNDFAKNILKKINYKYPDIQFHIIGDIGYINKFILNKYKNVIVHGKVKELKNILKNSICGLCNVEIATGFQNKILSYMSFGIPTVIRTNPNIEKKFKNGKEVLLSKNTDELINKIIQLKKNKKLANKLSINSQMLIKKKYSNKVLLKYSKII